MASKGKILAVVTTLLTAVFWWVSLSVARVIEHVEQKETATESVRCCGWLMLVYVARERSPWPKVEAFLAAEVEIRYYTVI